MLNKSSKSYLSRVIGLLLVAVILMQTTLISYAQGDSENPTPIFHEIDLAQMYNSLKSDPDVTSVNLDNNILSYQTVDGSTVSISSSYMGDLQKLVITENGIENTLTINENTQKVLLNNTPVTLDYEASEAMPVPVPYDNYTYISTSYPNIVAEAAIRNLQSSVLYSLLFSVLGGIGVYLGLATALISFYQSYGIYSNVVYVRRMSFRNSDWSELKYVDTYFYDSSYADYAYIRTETSYVR